MIGWGIPFTIVIPVFIACLEVELASGFLMALIVDPPIIITALIMVKHDYNAHRLWYIWLLTKAKIIDHWFFGAKCAASFPIKMQTGPQWWKPLSWRRVIQPRGVSSNAW